MTSETICQQVTLSTHVKQEQSESASLRQGGATK